MSDERDYYAELKHGLQRFFGEEFSNYSLECKQDYEQIYTMHGSVNIAPTHSTYILIVHINVNTRSFIINGNSNWIDALAIGHYSPREVQHTSGFHGQVLRANYQMSDLKDFIDSLNNETWRRFEENFTKQLESNLSHEDEN